MPCGCGRFGSSRSGCWRSSRPWAGSASGAPDCEGPWRTRRCRNRTAARGRETGSCEVPPPPRRARRLPRPGPGSPLRIEPVDWSSLAAIRSRPHGAQPTAWSPAGGGHVSGEEGGGGRGASGTYYEGDAPVPLGVFPGALAAGEHRRPEESAARTAVVRPRGRTALVRRYAGSPPRRPPRPAGPQVGYVVPAPAPLLSRGLGPAGK
ncbi:MAG: hypothetical protein QOH10_1221 [Actinomycetota bacterium]|nr:hypothetical protein [Actinomycetota bacterium]